MNLGPKNQGEGLNPKGAAPPQDRRSTSPRKGGDILPRPKPWRFLGHAEVKGRVRAAPACGIYPHALFMVPTARCFTGGHGPPGHNIAESDKKVKGSRSSPGGDGGGRLGVGGSSEMPPEASFLPWVV